MLGEKLVNSDAMVTGTKPIMIDFIFYQIVYSFHDAFSGSKDKYLFKIYHVGAPFMVTTSSQVD